MVDENRATLPPIRLPLNLLDAAKAKAERRDETLSQVVRRALRAYVANQPDPEPDEDKLFTHIARNNAKHREAMEAGANAARSGASLESNPYAGDPAFAESWGRSYRRIADGESV